ncbi:hypothetical protein cyc_01369 [Cyclospora cayetanensis]|uniref:Uncharacterized protein n=1 Tax=Cyclospora cayetanensis TaxID=88456 RepID=A0A1D3CXV4_9EIME|nr:hypothetical protein cyc_01369 [Cyclospora cayetanensis]
MQPFHEHSGSSNNNGIASPESLLSDPGAALQQQPPLSIRNRRRRKRGCRGSSQRLSNEKRPQRANSLRPTGARECPRQIPQELPVSTAERELRVLPALRQGSPLGPLLYAVFVPQECPLEVAEILHGGILKMQSLHGPYGRKSFLEANSDRAPLESIGSSPRR